MNCKLLLLALLTPACSSLNNLSGAKTLADGDHEMYTGLSLGALSRNRENQDKAFPALDLALRYGMTDQDEIVLKVTSNLTSYSMDYKKALVTGSNLYVTTGLGVGFYKDNFLRQENPLVGTDLSIPLFAEYFVSEQTSLLLGARLVRSVISDRGRSDFGSIMMTTGLRSGKASGLHLELGYGNANTASVPDLWQLSAGLYF